VTASGDPIVALDDVSLCYRLYTGRSHSLRDWVVARVRGRAHSSYRELWALKHVSLACREGDRLAVVGPNGAGKTSLLRVIAGIFPPTQGRLACRGRVVPLLELGLGFNGELTAAENIVLASVLLGRSRREAQAAVGRVVEFAELPDFVDVPVKYFSSGMAARLAFSLAMETEPDVLLLDEIFAVGDIHWIARAEARVMSLLERAKVVVMVSHNPTFLRRLCRRAIYIDHGEVIEIGDVGPVLDAYEQRTGAHRTAIVDNRATSATRLAARVADGAVRVTASDVPLLGECWIGLFPPGADRDGHLVWRRVVDDVAEVQFALEPGRSYEVRLYRWSPTGETLEASLDVHATDG
jgi:homopolymeric O-antigen transport system ATP-binding protein